VSLIGILNPLQSEINVFPETLQGIKRRIARRLAFPFPRLIPDFLLGWTGRLLNNPGRLYSFVGEKRNRE
jgi:hypothetical protein